MRSNIVIALAAFWVNFCLLGVLRSNAVIYKALVDAYGGERQGAAWPSGIFGFFMCVTGTLSGFLTYHVSLRNLAMLGVLLSSVAVSSSSMATSLNQIVYLYGALQGIGVGLIVPLTHVVLNQHFSQYRALALGVAYSGSSAGSFLFPPLAHLLLGQYGLAGTFLLLGGVMLNALVGAMLFRAPPEKQPAKSSPKCPPDERPVRISVVATRMDGIGVATKSRPGVDGVNHDVINCQISGHKLTEKSSSTAQIRDAESNKKSEKIVCCPRLVSSSKMAVEILYNPHFLIVSAAYAIYFSTSAIFLMVILDFAQDRGVSMQEGVYLVSAFSIGDCLGRLSFGWIADTRLVRRNVLVRLYLLGMGLLTGLFPLCPAGSMPALAVALGLLNGSVIVNHSVLLNEYLGIERLPIAVGFSMFFIGMTAMLRPLLIGVFRDRHKSYDHLFMLIGFLQVLITALWFLGSLVQSILRKRHQCANKSGK